MNNKKFILNTLIFFLLYTFNYYIVFKRINFKTIFIMTAIYMILYYILQKIFKNEVK